MAEPKHIIELRGSMSSYEADYAAWVELQAGLLAAGRWAELDLDNLIDEVKSLGRSEFHSFVSAIRVVLMHMLKWDYQEDYRSKSWADSINGHRLQIEKGIADNPSYKARIDEAVAEAYRRAVYKAAAETRFPSRLFPDTCPYSWEDITARVHNVPGKPFDGWKK